MSKIIKRAMAIAMAAALALMAGCGDKTGSDNQSGTLDVSDASNASNASSASNASNASNVATSEADVKSASERVAELAGQIELPSMAEVTADNLSTFLGIDSEKVSEFSAQICASGAMPDEFGVFVAVDENAAADIKSTLESRIEKQRDTYKDYTPDEMYKFDDCFAEQDGNCVFYAICADNKLAADILKG